MPKRKNNPLIVLVLLLVMFIIIAGISAGKWYKAKKEKEGLVYQIRELQGDISKKSSFVECEKINASRDDILNIYLLGAFAFPKEGGKHFWDLFVINPEGNIIGSGYPLSLPDMWQSTPINEDGDDTMDRKIGTGFNRKIGDYLIMVVPRQYVAFSDTYSLQFNDLLLAKDVPFSDNLLDHLYILRQTEDGIVPIIPAGVGCGY